jgi:hypothetical protein
VYIIDEEKINELKEKTKTDKKNTVLECAIITHMNKKEMREYAKDLDLKLVRYERAKENNSIVLVSFLCKYRGRKIWTK